MCSRFHLFNSPLQSQTFAQTMCASATSTTKTSLTQESKTDQKLNDVFWNLFCRHTVDDNGSIIDPRATHSSHEHVHGPRCDTHPRGRPPDVFFSCCFFLFVSGCNTMQCPRFSAQSNCMGTGVSCDGGKVVKLCVCCCVAALCELCSVLFRLLDGFQLNGSIPSTIGELTALTFM